MDLKRLQSILALAAGLLVSSVQAQVSLNPAINVFPGLRPDGLAAADFNGDGRLDLAVTADQFLNSDDVSILLSNRDGTFAPPYFVPLPNSSSPDQLVAGDLDGDGDADIAVVLRDFNQILVLKNSGTGAFTQAGTAPVGFNARGMDSGDIDNDGDIDLVVANCDSNTATVLLNNGAGAFSASTLAAGAEPRDAKLGDFDADGWLDLAVSNHDDRSVRIYRNVNGTFVQTVNLFVGANDRPDGLAVGDLDGDGRADVAAASGDDVVSLNRIVIFRANSASSFVGPTYVPTGGINSSSLVASDLDCDGDLDLAVTNQDSNNMSVLVNSGAAAFGAPIIMATGTRPGTIIAADFAQDGDLDLVTANRDSNDISIFINECGVATPVCGNGICEAGESADNCPGDCPPAGPICGNGICEPGESSANCPGDCGGGGPPGEFAFNSSDLFAGVEPSGVAAGDFNGDGIIDLASTADLTPASDNVAILLGTGKGSFAPPFYVNLPNSSSPGELLAGDLNGDGHLDLAVALKDFNQVIVLLNNGAANFTLGATAPTGAEPRGMSMIDADNDGDLDIAVANRSGNSVTVLLNNGNATFSSSTIAVGLEPRDVAWGDFSGKPKPNLAVTNHDSSTIDILMDSGGVYSVAATLLLSPLDQPEGVIAADFNGDELDDIAAVSGGGPNRVIVFLATGHLEFSAPAFYPTGPGVQNSGDLVAADVDCDGDLDLAVTNKDSNNLSALVNNGAGEFGAAVIFSTGAAPEQVIAIDADGDGAADVVTANRNSNDLTVLFNVSAACTPPPPPLDGDINGDGLVNVDDLLMLLAAWGPCKGCPEDIDASGNVNVDDLLLLLASWT